MADDGVEQAERSQLVAFGKQKGCPRHSDRALQRQQTRKHRGETPAQEYAPFQCHIWHNARTGET